MVEMRAGGRPHDRCAMSSSGVHVFGLMVLELVAGPALWLRRLTQTCQSLLSLSNPIGGESQRGWTSVSHPARGGHMKGQYRNGSAQRDRETKRDDL
ncbi:hypothetical protein UPYG_G00127610 [Umbra pygmaea]|uniref:Uncharacterized protein n=1 Tax=Umbra pygmaea TaxID=75934 RepID=A0ABD0X6M6_UMBPY